MRQLNSFVNDKTQIPKETSNGKSFPFKRMSSVFAVYYRFQAEHYIVWD